MRMRVGRDEMKVGRMGVGGHTRIVVVNNFTKALGLSGHVLVLCPSPMHVPHRLDLFEGGGDTSSSASLFGVPALLPGRGPSGSEQVISSGQNSLILS